MALPTKTNVVTMKFSKNGAPWVQVSPKAAVAPSTMAYSKDGSPWWGVDDDSGGGGGSLIKTVNGLAVASVKTWNGLAIASVKTINGLTNV